MRWAYAVFLTGNCRIDRGPKMRGIGWTVAVVATIGVCLAGAPSANAALSTSCSASALVTGLGALKCTTAPAACPSGQLCVLTSSVKVGVLLGIGPAAGTVTAGGMGPISCSGGSACSRSLTTTASGAQSASCAWTGTKLGLLARVNCRIDLTPIPPLSDAPVVTTHETRLTYTLGEPAVNLAPTLTVSDDSPTQGAATVTITNTLEGDQLTWTDNQPDIDATGSGTSTITFTGTASRADYEAALRDVRFTATTAGDPFRMVSFQVTDGLGLSSADTAASRVEVVVAA